MMVVRGVLTGGVLLAALTACGGGETRNDAAPASVSDEALAANAMQWMDTELHPTTLSRDEQLAEGTDEASAGEPSAVSPD